MGRFGRQRNASQEQLGSKQTGKAVGNSFHLSACLRLHGFDLLTMAVMGAIGLGVYFASLITAAVFQVFIKWLIGGLRPHFYAVCQPNIRPGVAPSGIGFANLMYDKSVCTGDEKEINDLLESKVMSAHNPAYWKMILFFAPILGACLISGALTIDELHNWYDVLAGTIIGICTALVAFRQTFASIFDFRFNHLLLPRATSLFHRQPFLPSASRGPFFTYQPIQEIAFCDLPFTREGGWGFGGGEQFVGAPGDATVLVANMGGPGTGARGLNPETGTMGNGFGPGGLQQDENRRTLRSENAANTYPREDNMV